MLARPLARSHRGSDETPASARGRASAAAPSGTPAFLRDPVESVATAPVVQQQCAACAAEESSEPVQMWDCSEYEEPACVQTHLAPDAPVQEKCAACEEEERHADGAVQMWDCSEYQEPACVQTHPADEPVQAKCARCEEEEGALQHQAAPGRSPRSIHREAARGLNGAGAPLPHGHRIQAAFGRHDVSHVRASVGGPARAAARRMGALAFTAGHRIGFRDAPDLRLAAHEAAHTVQQHAGLSLPGNVGRPGDRWERHADRVADAVVEGRSAERLLDEVAGRAAPADGAARAKPIPQVQQQITSGAARLLEPPPEPLEAPAAAAAEVPAASTGAPAGESAAPAGDAQGNEPSAIEEADAGATETPPEGVAEGGSAAGGGESAAAPAARGGGLNAPCYGRDPDPRPEETEEPASDPPPGEASAEASVTFDAWEEALDECPAEQAVAQGTGQTAATLTDASAADGGAPAAAAAAAPLGPAAGASAGAAGESASPEVRQMSSAADAAADQDGAPASAIDGDISAAESQRDAAVAEYESSVGLLSGVQARSARLEQGVTFGAGGSSESGQAAAEQVRAFLAAATSQMAGAVAFATAQVPQRLGGMADAMKANIQGAMEVEKGAISDRIAQARAQAVAGAAEARGHVHGEYAASAALVEAATVEAIAALDAEHLTSLDQVDLKETTGLDDVNARFAAGRTQHEDKGPEYSARAVRRGQEHAHAYERCKGDYSDDGFWDGCLTVRRAKAQQDAACKTAAGYKDAFHRTANKKGYDLKELRKQYRCAVIAGARQVNQTLDQTHGGLVSGLERGRMQAVAGLAAARTQNLAAIDSALHATLTALAAQEHAQRQAANDAGYLKQVAIEELAHTAAANLGRGISAAMDSLDATLTALRDTLSRSGAPDPLALSRSLAAMQLALGGGMGTLLGRMEEGAAGAEARIAGAGAAALEGLAAITTGNDDQAQQAEAGFRQQMSGLMRGASRTFGELANNHVRQAQDSSAQGVASMQQAVAGFDEALATIGGRIDEAIAASLGELDQELSGKLGELDGQIAAEAWKAAEKEQPAWKSVVAIVLVVLVIIAAAVISIVTLGAGASLFAIILVGALVGAVSAGLIQIINNWASGEAWHSGLAQAMIMGAIGGALGGGLGFAGGALASGAAAVGARAATQFAITVGADLVAEGITQTIGYVAFGQEFSWQGFFTAGAMSGVSFRAHPVAPRGAAPHAPVPHAAPSPAAAGSAGGRRAAVAQVAGGAAVGFGVEAAGAAITGEKFDVTRAVSSAAAGAVGARASRRGAGAPSSAPEAPKTGLGRAAERVRGFDPGGIGARLEEGLGNAGRRAFGGPDATGAAGRTPGGEAAPRAEADATRARAPEEPAEPRPRPMEEAEAIAPRPAEETATPPRPPEDAEVSRPRGPEEVEAARLPRAADANDPLIGRAVEVSINGETHTLSVQRIGDRRLVILCSNQCGECLLKIRRLQTQAAPDSDAWRALEGLAQRAIAADSTINDVTPNSTPDQVRAADDALNGLRDGITDIQTRFGNLIDPNVPAVNAPGPPAPPTGTRVDFEAHLPPGVERVGDPVTVDLSKGVPELDARLQNPEEGVEFVYVLRDNTTGEILKVGETADVAQRARDYETAARRHAMGRSVSMEVQPVRIGTDAAPDIRSVEGQLRASIEAGVIAERAASGGPVLPRTPPLPWDATAINLGGGQQGSRLIPHGEPAGQGTPGKYDPARETRARPPAEGETPLQPHESYWWRERKWTASGNPPPPYVPEWRAPLFAEKFSPVPRTAAELNARLGEMFANPAYHHNGKPSIRAIARALGVPYERIRDYLVSAGVSPAALAETP